MEIIDMKEKLPNRVFYSLSDAAGILKCTPNDLIHFASIGVINLSAYIETIDNRDNEIFLLSTLRLNEKPLDSNIFYVHGLELTEEQPDSYGFYQYTFLALSGVFYIRALNLMEIEFDDDVSDVVTMFIAPRPLGDDVRTYIPNTMEQKIKVKRKNLCIHFDDLFNFNSSPVEIPTGLLENHVKAPILTVHQFNMMYALLRIAGLSDNDINNISPDTLNEKLGQIGSRQGINIPTPDKNTWVKWRAKFR